VLPGGIVELGCFRSMHIAKIEAPIGIQEHSLAGRLSLQYASEYDQQKE
jgi:hypothetical protein